MSAEHLVIDLGWTPAPNVLPIRRLGVEVGHNVHITTVWDRFPELAIVPNDRIYERTDGATWRYLD